MTKEKWLEERKYGIGASDISAVMGINKFKTNMQLWEEKTGRREPEDIGDKPYVKFGNDAEGPLRELFALEHPEYIVQHEEYDLVRHPIKPFIYATPDGNLLHRVTGARGGLEIKTTEIRRATDWMQWDKKIPDMYYMQVLQQMHVMDWQFVYVWAYIRHYTREGDMALVIRRYKVERSDCLEDIETVAQAATEFWELVESDTKPNLKLPPI